MDRVILVPVDGSEFAEAAVPLALTVARGYEAGVELVHVHQPFLPGSYVEGAPSTDPWEQSAREQERRYLDELAGRHEAEGVPLRTTLLEGPVVKTLVGRLREKGAELVVMTTHGRGPLERAWLGSVADGLIRESPAPVLLVRPGADGAPPEDWSVRHVLIPLDESERAQEIIPHAVSLGKVSGARFTLLRVVPPPVLVGLRYPVGTVPLDPEELERREASAHEFLAEVAAPLRDQGLEVETAVLSHPQAAAAILEYAGSHGADLIAMATHGRGGVARALLGSVADKVLRGAETPVVVFRPEH